MNKYALLLLAGCLAAAPLMAKTKTQTKKSAAIEAEAWGNSGKPAKKNPGKAAPAKNKKTLAPTVDFHDNPKIEVKLSPKKPVEATHQKKNEPVAKDGSEFPSAPADFGSEAEGKAYQKDLENAQNEILSLLSQATKKRYEKPESGVNGVIALNKQAQKALNSGLIPGEDRDALLARMQERDTALYMLSASLLARKKNAEAAQYLRFLANSAGEGTPLRQTAEQQLQQIGYQP